MKRKTNYKNLISLALVLILLLVVSVSPAYAVDFPPLSTAGRRLGSWILSALTAMNITLSSTAYGSTGSDIINFLADPLDLTYSYSEAWNDRPTIQIWDDYVTIDGVTYTDIWLSNEAASKFKTDGLDFSTAYDIASQSNGTFASGIGDYNGFPIFNVNGSYRTQNYSVGPQQGTYNLPGLTLTQSDRTDGRVLQNSTFYNGNTITSTPIYSQYPQDYYLRYQNGSYQVIQKRNGDTLPNVIGGYQPSSYYNSNSFDFDWVAGTIDTSPLETGEGMMIRVPSDTPGLQQFIQNNYYLTEPTVVDPLEIPDIMLDIDDLADILAPILVNLDNDDITFTVNHTEPAPAPIPDVPIIDATVPQVVQPIINEITNQGDIISQQIPQIIETIPTIDDICNNIDTAPYHDLDTGLDRLPSFFLPFITDLRSALGIWHYVTEWLSQVSTTFAFISGCLVGTSIMTPIYAAIAGFMCIKVYRRMTG